MPAVSITASLNDITATVTSTSPCSGIVFISYKLYQNGSLYLTSNVNNTTLTFNDVPLGFDYYVIIDIYTSGPTYCDTATSNTVTIFSYCIPSGQTNIRFSKLASFYELNTSNLVLSGTNNPSSGANIFGRSALPNTGSPSKTRPNSISELRNTCGGIVDSFGQSIVFDADNIMLRFIYVDGRDLDIRARMTAPTTSGYLGWSSLNNFPASPPYVLIWGGDNTGSGSLAASTAEAVLINLNNFRTVYSGSTTIDVECRAFWYSATGSTPVRVEATFWKGGTVLSGSFQFSNPTATSTELLDSLTKSITTLTQSSSTTGDFIATFRYNDSTNTGQFIV